MALKPGYVSLKIIGNYMDRFATYDFLLTFHCNRGPILYRFRDIRHFSRKSPLKLWPSIEIRLLLFF